MPGFCTHYIFGEDFIVDLPQEKKHSKKFRAAFFYGVQGPDYMLFHRALPTMPGKSIRKLSTRLHNDDPAPLFARFQKLAELNPQNDYVGGYVAGFLCHYALDRCAHPYVNFLQEGIMRKENIKYLYYTVHNRIETNIDRYMLNERLKIKDPRKFMPSDVLTGNKKVVGAISSIMSKTIASLYNESIPKKTMETAFYDFVKVDDMLSDATYWKKPVMRIIELPVRAKYGPILTDLIRSGKMETDWDYANVTKHPWVNIDAPGSKTHNESFLEIYDEALRQAHYMYDALLRGEDTNDITENITFSKGIKFRRTEKEAQEG